MKRMPLSRLFALPLALTLLLSPAAQALTPNQARELLQDYYIDEVPEDVLDQNTIQAMLEALGDPYTTYFSPEEYGAFTGSMSDTDTVGVGIYSLVTADGPLIQRVYENTPAADAGLQPGDLVTAVDGRSTAGQDAGTVAAWLKGDPGTRVELSYRRDGAEYTAVLTRRAITVPATYTELWDGHIGYIDCDTFGGETVAHFVSGMEDTAAGADHWIVDLRGNGGGEVDAAMGAAGCFTGSGVLAYLKDSTGAYGAYGSNDDARTLSPVIVLTDGETASASELFASDIRDTNTGILVGGRTFGKGVAQTVLDQRALPDYFPDGDAIKITSYRFYAPSGSTTDTVGLIPHLLVDPDLAPEVATLLSASSPKGSTEGYLRIDFNWRWYVELDTALSETHRDAFTALLEALPDGVRVLEGTGGPDGWADTTVEELVGRYVLTSYRDRSFTDTAGSPYAAQIDRLATYGILAGTGGGAFQPEGSLTRAQLCALLAQALNCRVPTGESQFTDVSMDDWYGLCVNAVARLGLVEGVGEGRFAPDAPVSHEQFITIMARLSQRLNMYMDLTLQEMPADAAEAAGLLSYSGWARDSVWLLALSQKGLLGNTINLLWEPLEDIDPAAVTTREEAAALTCTLLNYFGHSVCFYRSGQQQLVVGLVRAAGFAEQREELLHGQLLLLLPRDIRHNPAVVEHDQAVAVGDGIAHVMGNHEGGQLIPLHDLLRGVQNLGRRFGVQGGGVLVQQQEPGLLQRGHQQSQGLPLAAGEQAHLAGQPVLQSQIQDFQQLPVLLPLGAGDAGAEGAALPPAGGQGQVFLDLHGGRGAHHGVLKHPADEPGPLVLRQAGHILPADGDGAAVHRVDARHQIEQGGLARAVAADDGGEVPFVEGEGDTVHGPLLVDGAGVEGLINFVHFKHGERPPSARAW